MQTDGMNRRDLCKAAVAVTLVGISKAITTHAEVESKPEQMTRVTTLLDERGRRTFHACRALPELFQGDFTALAEITLAE